MNEDSDIPAERHLGVIDIGGIPHDIVQVQYGPTPVESLNDALATKNKKSVLQRVGSLFGGKKSKDKAVVESEEDVVAQLKKDLDECRIERDRFKIALLASDAEKKELMTKMELNSSKIENLEAKIEYEAKLGAKEIEILKRESDILNEKLQASRDEIDRYKNELTAPEGQRSLKAFNDMYIRASQGLKVDLALYCEESEHWTITEHDGKVVIRANVDKFLRAHWPGGCVDLADVAQSWEQWTPVKNGDGTWSFRSHHDTWLSAAHGIVCTKPHNQRCERFKLESW